MNWFFCDLCLLVDIIKNVVCEVVGRSVIFNRGLGVFSVYFFVECLEVIGRICCFVLDFVFKFELCFLMFNLYLKVFYEMFMV